MYCCVPTVPTHPTKCRWATGKGMHKREKDKSGSGIWDEPHRKKKYTQMADFAYYKVFIYSTVAKIWAEEHPSNNQGNPGVGLTPLEEGKCHGMCKKAEDFRQQQHCSQLNGGISVSELDLVFHRVLLHLNHRVMG